MNTKVVLDLLLVALSYTDIEQNQVSEDLWRLWMLINKSLASDDKSI